MARTGRVTQLFRYPVKSMQGEALSQVDVSDLGILGDRTWAVRDEKRGDFSTGKRLARLMECRARAGKDGAPEVELPDGTRISADDPDASKVLSEALDHPVTLWPIDATPTPSTQIEPVEDPDADFRAMTARADDEAQPDFSQIPPDLLGFLGRAGGPFVDLSPMLVMTEQSIRTLAAAAPDSKMDARRFRPSLLIEAEDGSRFPEQDWLGRRLRVGEVELDLQMTCARCVMTTHGFADLPKDPVVMRKLVSEADGNLGVYGMVLAGGSIRIGDAVELLD